MTNTIHHWTITNGRYDDDAIVIDLDISRETLRAIRYELKQAMPKVYERLRVARQHSLKSDWRTDAELLKEYTIAFAFCEGGCETASQIAGEHLLEWVCENDPPDEDGESEREYFAYGYAAGDKSDHQRLTECLVEMALN